jgi:hypothetical protein
MFYETPSFVRVMEDVAQLESAINATE